MPKASKKESDTKEIMINIRVPESFLAGLDLIRRDEPDLPPRSTMARRCVERAIAAKLRAKGKAA